MHEEVLDLLIVGAGPIGLACGIEAVKNNLSYTIIDKGTLVNSLYHYPQNMTFFSTSDKIEIGDVPFISHNPKPTRSEALEYYRRVTKSWKLNVRLYEAVKSIKKEEANTNFIVQTEKGKNKYQYKSQNVVIATGFFDLPNLMNIPGEELPKVSHYYTESHPYFGQKIAIIGAANSAVDVALETFRKGAKEVTLIALEDNIKESVKYWVRPDIENRIKEGEIKAYFNSSVKEIGLDYITINTPNGEQKLPNDFVLAMTGYQPDFSFLKAAGVDFQDDEYQTPIYNEENYESNVEGLYLAGVVCGGLKTNKWFIENSREHAVSIVENIRWKLKN